MSVANEIIQIEPGDKILFEWKFARWLGTSTIASVTWSVTNTNLTISDESNTTTTATAYFSVPSGTALNSEYWVKTQIVTADTVARTESRSILVKVVRKTG